MLRQGRVWRDGSSWTRDHRRWLAAQSFGHPALDVTYAQYRAVLAARDAELASVEAELMPWCAREPFTTAAGQPAEITARRGYGGRATRRAGYTCGAGG